MLLIDYLNKLREKTHQAGVPQVALATGLPAPTIYRFANGGGTTEKTIVAVEAALKKMEKKG
jgi:hypothetical protein